MDSICKNLSRHAPCYTNPLYHPEAWREYERRVYRLTRDIQNEIPIGTVLWHGTTREDPTFHPGRVAYFGLEPVISVWYTLEEAEKKNRDVGYVYRYRTIRPIPLDRYIPVIEEHPGIETALHPQVVLHGYNNYNAMMGPFDLSIELTLQERDWGALHLEKRYFVDVHRLQTVKEFPISHLSLVETENHLILQR